MLPEGSLHIPGLNLTLPPRIPTMPPSISTPPPPPALDSTFFTPMPERREIIVRQEQERKKQEQDKLNSARLLDATENASPPPSPILESRHTPRPPMMFNLPAPAPDVSVAVAAPAPAPDVSSAAAAARNICIAASQLSGPPPKKKAKTGAGEKTKTVESRLTYSVKQKREILILWKDLEREQGKTVGRTEIAQAIQDRLGCTVKRGFLTNLRKSEQKLMSNFSAYEENLKRISKDKLASLNDKLEAWFNNMEAKDAVLTDLHLIQKAKSIAQTEKLDLPKSFNFSTTWLLRFKRKRQIGLEVMHGEAAGVDSVGIAQCRTHLPVILSQFNINDIYNFDESGLFYRQLPTRSLMRKMRKGNKLNKHRCTINLICNATGNDLHLQLIGLAKQPRAFGKSLHPYNHFKIDYYYNATSWMRADIFTSVMRKFSNRVRGKGESKR